MERIREEWEGDREKKLEEARTMMFRLYEYIQVFFYTIYLKNTFQNEL